MKKISLFPLALLVTFCLGLNIQAKEDVQKRKVQSKSVAVLKRALGIGLGACAFTFLVSSIAKMKPTSGSDGTVNCSLLPGGGDLVLDKQGKFGLLIIKSLYCNFVIPIFRVTAKGKEYLDKKGLRFYLSRNILPVVPAAILGYASFKLIASSDCSKEEDTEEATV